MIPSLYRTMQQSFHLRKNFSCTTVVLIALFLFTVTFANWSHAAMVNPANLRCEYLSDPVGMDEPRPRFSWVLESSERGEGQTAYRILVARSTAALEKDQGDLWDSGKVGSDRSIHVEYEGKPLQPLSRYFWKVQVWNRGGNPSKWSEAARFITGLLVDQPAQEGQAEQFAADWIGAASGSDRQNALWFRREFELRNSPSDALACVASVGFHELYVNGEKVGDEILVPSISDLSKRAHYRVYDLSGRLKEGKNALALWCGPGWGNWSLFSVPQAPLALVRLEVRAADGSVTTIGTDETWKVHPSSTGLTGSWNVGDFGGERIDAGKDLPGWNLAGFDDSGWEKATRYAPDVRISLDSAEPNRKLDVLKPVAIEEATPSGVRVDLGRNFTGWTEIEMEGTPGSTVSIDFSEREDQACTYAIRSEYTFDSAGKGQFRNRFNYSTGRWITIGGNASTPKVLDVTGYLVHNGYERVGQFQCSNELLNNIYRTTLWTFESLSLSGYVVDCPHRERRGYGGDGHATMETALNNFGLGAFYTRWMRDWRDVQAASGDIPYTAPTYDGGGGPAWSGFTIHLPWSVYERYGDVGILRANYPMMKRWIAFVETKMESGLVRKWGGIWDFLGDWVPPGRDQGDNRVDERSTLLFNNCYYILSLDRMGRIAEVLGEAEEAEKYRRAAEALRRSVHEEFFNPSDFSYANGLQLDESFPLLAGVPPADARGRVIERLENEIRVAKKGHLDTGIHGTWLLLKQLTEENRNDLIYEMALKRDWPGWGWMLDQGATTIWEQWDGGNSRLHSSFLSVGSWFIEGVAGIRPDREHPGYKHFTIRPGIGGGLTWARGELKALYGNIVSDWKIEKGRLHLEVEVPVNTTATIILPDVAAFGILESGQPLEKAKGIISRAKEGTNTAIDVESGKYRFEAMLNPAVE